MRSNRSISRDNRQNLHQIEYQDRKYQYLTDQNNPRLMDSLIRSKILETISEEGISQEKGSITNRQQNFSKVITPRSEINTENHKQNQLQNRNSYRLLKQKQIASPINKQSGTGRIEFNNQKRRKSPYHQDSENINLSFKKSKCYQCDIFNNKIQQLTNSYELLLHAKNQEIEDCKLIIDKMEQKLKAYQKRNQQQLQKNKKIRWQIQRKNTQQMSQRQRQNQMIQYLKNRQISLLQQMKELQNQSYINELKRNKASKLYESNSSSNILGNNYFPQKIYNNRINEQQEKYEKSSGTFVSNSFQSQNSAKNTLNLFQTRQALINTCNIFNKNIHVADRLGLIERVPLNEIIKKANQIEVLKDDLIVSELKNKIQKTKNFETLYLNY